jgi:hypothetical protein
MARYPRRGAARWRQNSWRQQRMAAGGIRRENNQYQAA